MEKANILYHDIQDIENILGYVIEIAEDKMPIQNTPWLKSMYFAGRTLCLDMYSNGVKDSMTFCMAYEDVGFFSGGRRVLLSIESCKRLEYLMKISGIKHESKWLLPRPWIKLL